MGASESTTYFSTDWGYVCDLEGSIAKTRGQVRKHTHLMKVAQQREEAARARWWPWYNELEVRAWHVAQGESERRMEDAEEKLSWLQSELYNER